MIKIVNELIKNENFKSNLIKAFKEITADHEINEKDIPILIKFIALNYNQIRNLEIKEEDIKGVLLMATKTILIDENLISLLEYDQFEPLIRASFDLLTIQLKTVSKIKLKLKKYLCCKKN